jgi:predicted enzyme related to lactoylglutathione lyase
VGLTVGDIDAAVEWYRAVFELELVAGPFLCDRTTPGVDRRVDVFGEQWRGMKLAHLESANGAGLELFEFVDPCVEGVDETFAYWRVGTHHVAMSVDDLDDALGRLLASGGKQRTAVHRVNEQARVCYCEDPWGNVVELVSTSYAGLVT